MTGLLLDPRTGAVEGRVPVPRSGEVEAWAEQVERGAALGRSRDLLARAREHPGLQATTTTNRYLCAPAAAAGISRATSGAAWTNSAYTEIIAANAITTTFYIAGVTWMWWTPLAAVDTTYEIELALGVGGAGAEVEKIVIPSSVRNDTAVGMMPSNFVMLPEPHQVAANSRVAVRVRYGTAAAVTLTGIKVWYQTV